MDNNRCNICVKHLDLIKCNKCTFLSCEECIVKWYDIPGSKYKCPQCKQVRTYDIEYDYKSEESDGEDDNETDDDMPELISVEGSDGTEFMINSENAENAINTENMLISNFAAFALTSDIINSTLYNNQVFAADNFIENYNNWPVEVKNNWSYIEETMQIDDINEVIAYRIYNNIT